MLILWQSDIDLAIVHVAATNAINKTKARISELSNLLKEKKMVCDDIYVFIHHMIHLQCIVVRLFFRIGVLIFGTQ